eukprot:5109438-Karenia_brevis.AAC.1
MGTSASSSHIDHTLLSDGEFDPSSEMRTMRAPRIENPSEDFATTQYATMPTIEKIAQLFDSRLAPIHTSMSNLESKFE